MDPEHARLEELRDLALRDLTDIDDQVAAGDLSPEDAEELRRRYEREALAAMEGLQARAESTEFPPPADAAGATASRASRLRSVTSRRLLYAVGIALTILAAFLVQQYLLDRPPGGLVTGNEMLQRPSAAPPPPSRGTDAQLEAAVAANPQVVGMRLLLARRYLDEGRYDLAVVHYTKVLEQEPKNPEALTHLAWVMLQVGRTAEAARLVDTAVGVDPQLADAWWVQASVRLYGLKDPQAAIRSVDRLRGRTDLGPVVRRQVRDLRAKAERMLERGS